MTSPRFAFLRGINVGGNNKLSMADLRRVAAELGLQDPKTLLQSGNLIFQSDEPSEAKIESALEDKVRQALKLNVEFHVRTLKELQKVVAENPFPQEALADPSHLVVLFQKRPVIEVECEAVRAAIRGSERIHSAGRQVYIVYPDGIGDSKLTNSVLDSKLGQRGTARNWNTLLKLLGMAASAK